MGLRELLATFQADQIKVIGANLRNLRIDPVLNRQNNYSFSVKSAASVFSVVANSARQGSTAAAQAASA